MILAIFDFDGTITRKDSLINFIQYGLGHSSYYMGLLKLSPILAAYTFKLIRNHIAKEKLFIHFFKGYDAEDFQNIAEKYSLEQIDKITRPKAIEKIKWHKKEGHKVIIVSASMENWLKEWCHKNGIDLIATKLEVIDSKLTGRFATKNCYGIEKVNRIKESYDLALYEYIYAYGDSSGDKEMLLLADEVFYKPFR